MVFIGTAYFNSREDAYKYYAKQETNKKSVKQYIKEGLIIIGIPKVPNEFDLSLDEDGRYWKEEKEIKKIAKEI